MSGPSISVVIPTYNGAPYIRAALESVFAQTLPPSEIVVVDDCSRDDTLQVVEAIAARAPLPVRLIRLRRNSGSPARPFNVGVREARGDLIAGLDQDDLFTPDKLLIQAGLLAAEPRFALAGGFCCYHATPGQVHPFQRDIADLFHKEGHDLANLPGRAALRMLIGLGNYLIGYPGFVFRKQHWQRKGGVDERLPVGSDYDFVCWLCLQGRVAFLPSIHYLRREHHANVCNNRLKMHLDLARVRGRYLARERWLLEDGHLSHNLHAWHQAFAHQLRQAGSYRASLECYRHLGRVWGWDWYTIKAVLKLPLHWVWSCATKRPPVYTEWTHPGEPRQTRKAA
jgi:glycosyltransferase involved in cell wall biosynthesis